MALIDSFDIGELTIQIHVHTSDFSQFPGVRIEVPDGYRILGGGACVNWFGCGNLLTGMFPEGDRVWIVTAKGDKLPCTATVTGYCVAARMKDGSSIPVEDYDIIRQDSEPVEQPSAEAILPKGWVVIGGGARANWTGEGSLLFASHPGERNSWIASAKDHITQEVATVSAFAIGVKKSLLDEAGLTIFQKKKTSAAPIAHPNVNCVLDPGFQIVCGGAKTNWNGAGSLLTASFPQDRRTWVARGMDHRRSDPATITAWAIGLSKK